MSTLRERLTALADEWTAQDWANRSNGGTSGVRAA